MDSERVGQASRLAAAGAIASSRSRAFLLRLNLISAVIEVKIHFGETPKPARETRALPGQDIAIAK
jgi:hypothetical protein